MILRSWKDRPSFRTPYQCTSVVSSFYFVQKHDVEIINFIYLFFLFHTGTIVTLSGACGEVC